MFLGLVMRLVEIQAQLSLEGGSHSSTGCVSARLEQQLDQTIVKSKRRMEAKGCKKAKEWCGEFLSDDFQILAFPVHPSKFSHVASQGPNARILLGQRASPADPGRWGR